jgi:pimeloyl-ACP methyl ester carboxylesterase
MTIIDIGSGAPVVIVPGIQGRWEWMQPTVEALAARCRVITFSLADEPTCGGRFDDGQGFACYVQQIEDALDQTGVDKAVICGVSYGGLIAAAFAARRRDRVAGLILVSAIPPTWKPDARARFFLRAPWLLSPLFLVASLRMYREIAAAHDGFARGAFAALRHAANALTHMFSPGRMARRVHMLSPVDLRRELQALDVPTLVITGEPAFDRVVPVPRTLEYLRMWPHAAHATIERTGHLGLITRPREFAALVAPFVDRNLEPGTRNELGTRKEPGTTNERGTRNAEPGTTFYVRRAM